jgi:p-cumate 2,3-dioxygenase ferredoxin component
MVFLCLIADVPPSSVRRVALPNAKPIAVYNIEGNFFATDDRCTHGQASLSDGMVEDGFIVCPLHFGSFDIRTGQPAAPPCTIPIATHKVVVRENALFLQSSPDTVLMSSS